jgi:GNAT superfamily N-acetyltransferase
MRIGGEPGAGFTHRLARRHDLPALKALMAASIGELQRGFLDKAQIDASRMVMGLDSQLVEDGTYFLVESNAALAGCGGWSRRATLYGGDHGVAPRDAGLLDPATNAARVRAMYTHPDFVRRGVGRLILALCEEAATAAGFARVQLMATLAGEPLYRSCGYEEIERTGSAPVAGVVVPLVLMGKTLVRGRRLY